MFSMRKNFNSQKLKQFEMLKNLRYLNGQRPKGNKKYLLYPERPADADKAELKNYNVAIAQFTCIDFGSS